MPGRFKHRKCYDTYDVDGTEVTVDVEDKATHEDLEKLARKHRKGHKRDHKHAHPDSQPQPPEPGYENQLDVTEAPEATPAAEAEAEKADVKLAEVKGTGKDGKVTKADVKKAESKD